MRATPSEGPPRAGEASTGYALRVFPRAINTAPRRSTNKAKTYTYPQPALEKSASTPGSIFGRHGGGADDFLDYFKG